jgi:hypothetical protein
MNQALRPQPLLSEVLPGALCLGLILYIINSTNVGLLDWINDAAAAKLALAAGAFLLGSWILGTFLDSARNLLEHCWDRLWGELNWNFFFYAPRDKVAQFDENYYAYYTAKANYVIGLLVALAFFAVLSLFGLRAVILFGALVVLAVCLLDAIVLRIEIKPLLRNPDAPPHTCRSPGSKEIDTSQRRPAHTGVFTRLAPSHKFPGIGVFAIRDIPAGANVFAGDDNEMREIDPNDLIGIEPEIKKLYCDFCVFKDGKIKGPTNFNNLTVGWYLNHSDEPNVLCGSDYDFFTARDIKKGEELTVNYSTYDDRPVPSMEGRGTCL